MHEPGEFPGRKTVHQDTLKCINHSIMTDRQLLQDQCHRGGELCRHLRRCQSLRPGRAVYIGDTVPSVGAQRRRDQPVGPAPDQPDTAPLSAGRPAPGHDLVRPEQRRQLRRPVDRVSFLRIPKT